MDPKKVTPYPRAIDLPTNGEPHLSLLKGAPDSAGMRSGYVRLLPGESVGLHSTEGNEEVVVPLSGTGELRSPGAETLAIHPGRVLYNPPHTPHDVVNTGSEPLCYIYIVAKAD
jgi:mannose-6-phosphate isomerase-like protein (cupin superfamily)